jgi:multidrug efflux system membrane fusion protein
MRGRILRGAGSMRRAAVFALVGAGLLAGLAGFYLNSGSADAANDPKPAPPVPVQVATATRQDMPVYLRGLGTVQAFNAVDIKAQVNGYLEQVPVREGQEVHKGDIVAVIDPRPYQAALDQAVAQRQQDQAQLADAQLDLKRYQLLAQKSFAPAQQVDTQQATVNKLVAAIQGDSANIEKAQLNLDFCLVRSPIDGKVSLRKLDPGNLIEASSQTAIVSITQDKPISLIFTLPEQDLPQVQTAMQQATLPVQAYSPNDQTKFGTGQLLTPNNTIDVSSGTIQFKAEFANANDTLWPGEFVNAHLLVDTLRNVLTVPHVAIQHGPEGLSVYVVEQDGTTKRVPVQIGYDDGTNTVVAKGLAEGDKVVTAGQSRLGDGTHVTVGTPSS